MTGITSVAKKTVKDLVTSKRVAFTLAEFFSPHCAGRRKIAFTLAEVLITLGIIGVVASLTMPTLIRNKQDQELIVRTKKVWSDINNAILLSQQDYGVIGDNSILFNATDSDDTIIQNLAKYFNGAKVCLSTQNECKQYKYDVKYATKVVSKQNNTAAVLSPGLFYSKIILSNGAILSLVSNRSGCKPKAYINYISPVCANAAFDVNGTKAPNQFGRDVYYFWVYREKLYPNIRTNPERGSVSFMNILSGKDKLEYFKYEKGQKFD